MDRNQARLIVRQPIHPGLAVTCGNATGIRIGIAPGSELAGFHRNTLQRCGSGRWSGTSRAPASVAGSWAGSAERSGVLTTRWAAVVRRMAFSREGVRRREPLKPTRRRVPIRRIAEGMVTRARAVPRASRLLCNGECLQMTSRGLMASMPELKPSEDERRPPAKPLMQSEWSA